MSLDQSSIAVKPGSNKNFGFVFSGFFTLLGLYPLFNGGQVNYWVLSVVAVLLLTTLIRPTMLAKPNYYWFKFGLFLGAIVSPIVIGTIYLTIIVPIGMIMKLCGANPLDMKFDKEADSYWIERKVSPQPMKNQF